MTTAQREWRLAKIRAARVVHQNQFRAIWKGAGFPALQEEVPILQDRRRFDFADCQARVAIEIQGQIWQKGGHNTGKGMMRDAQKSFDAAMLGWIVIPLTPDMIGFSRLRQIYELMQKRRNGSL